MLLSRRFWLASIAAMALKGAALRDMLRLPDEWRDSCGRHYVARATVTLLGMPVFSRSGVGEGYVRYNESPLAAGRSIDIEFGAGSFPEKAHAVNKMGLIRESVTETQAGDRVKCAYFGFMTTSQEATLHDARKSFLPVGETLTYSVGCGTATRDGVNGRTIRIQLPSRYDWRDFTAIAREARSAVEANLIEERAPLEPGAPIPATFLYAVRKAMLDPHRLTEEELIFNGRYFSLRTEKQPDAATGAEFAALDVVRSADRVVRLTGTLQLKSGNNRTSFRVWFESGSPQSLPLRFDYQAKSFLRLSFVAGAPDRLSPRVFETQPRK